VIFRSIAVAHVFVGMMVLRLVQRRGRSRLGADPVDEADAAQIIEERERATALADITRFNPAIVPPEARECTRCEDDIPAARLAARPTARYCTPCQAGLDRR
jgi:RNA polymerase-binding transcription factor DksA